MGKLTGRVVDEITGEPTEARVQVLSSSGRFVHPPDAVLKVGPGVPFFYCDGAFEVDTTRGAAQIIVERGTEYVPARVTVDVPAQGVVATDIVMRRWSDLPDRGWHPGNTHIHYDENETRADERLRLDPRVEDLRMTAVSVLRRRDLEYATNKYPPGMLTEFSSAHHYIQCGEETRHNEEPWRIGYGHVMLLSIRNIVHPVSRGVLVDAFDPDYPPLCYACDDAHRQGGVVIWCHNGQGMEAPVAAALGKLDAFNLFDPHWNDAEYDIHYRMLNAGLRLPASTGSDWFICSANRVYGHTGGTFDYELWVQALKEGRTFITNGPALFLSVEGKEPGGVISTRPGERLSVLATWQSHFPIKRVELLFNGDVAMREQFAEGSTHGHLEADLTVASDGWVAVRASSDVRDSFAQPVFAHTSPVYLETGLNGPESRAAGIWFDEAIERSLEWVRARGRFYSDNQRQEVVDLFREAQAVYRAMGR